MFQPVAANLDPKDYIIAPPVAAIDEFRMTDDDGSFVADINESFIDKFVQRMNEREQLTGDLCPLVVGHTPDPSDGFVPEINQPPIVGFARSWFKAPLGNTGRQAAFFTPWIRKDRVGLAKDHPRRSCEVWVTRYEADPISLLGATTPCRDLGLMKLSRNGSLNLMSPGDPISMNDNPNAPKPDAAEAGPNKDLMGKLDQLISVLTQFVQSAAPAGAGAPGAAPPMPGADAGAGAAPAPGADAGSPGVGEMSDAELDQLLAGMGTEGGAVPPNGPAPSPSPAGPQSPDSRKGAPVEKESACAPGGNAGNTNVQPEPVKMQRNETPEQAELRDMKIRLSRITVERQLEKLATPEIPSTDEALVSDLMAMPSDVRQRYLERLTKLARPQGFKAVGLDKALGAADGTPAPDGKKRLGQLPADQQRSEVERITKLARSKNSTFDIVMESEGYTR